MNNKGEYGLKKFWSKNSTLVTMGLVVAALGTSLYIMSTFSRNTSTMRGGDTGSVAKFEYEIKQTEKIDNLLSATNEAPPINIFDTATDSGVASSDNSKLLAPGTAGYFEFLFRNKSQAPVKVTFDTLNYTESNNNDLAVPVIFYFNGKYYSDLYDQSLSPLGSIYNGKYGRDWTYYFNEGESKNNIHGIRLTGNLTDFKTELNQFSANTLSATSSDNATAFLNYSGSTTGSGASEAKLDQDYVKLAWFYPFDARLTDVTNPNAIEYEEGIDPGSGYKIYAFDEYNGNFISGNTTISMSPVIRVSQIDEYSTNTKNNVSSHADNHGYYADGWFRPNKSTEVTWGED